MSSPSIQATTEARHVAVLARIHAGELPLPAAIRVIAGCPAAATALAQFQHALRRLRLPPSHPLPWAAVCYGLDTPERCARRDVERARRVVKRLCRLAPRRRLPALQLARDRSSNPALIDALIVEARRALDDDPHEALTWLELPTLVIQRLRARGFPEALLAPGWLRVAAHRANAHRVAGDLREADRRFRALASEPYRRELARLEVEVEILSLEASLRIDLRQFQVADDLLVKAEGHCRSVGDRLGLARVLLQRGGAAYYSGVPQRAAEHERRAAELLESDVDVRLYVMSRHNLADTLVELGRPAEAAALLAADPDLVDRAGDPTVRLRQRWIEGRIARAEERHAAAERLYLEVHDAWMKRGRPYEAALATLDLAELDLARGDCRRVQQRTALLAPIFEARGVHREARAALILFQQAAEAERLTAEFLSRLRHYLHFAPRDHRLRFDPAAGAVSAD